MAEAPLDGRVGDAGDEDVRQRIGHDQQGLGLEDLRAEEQVGQRRGEEHQARQAVEEVQHGVEVAQPLAELEPLAQQGVVGTEDLRHAARPADTLADMPGQALGGQAGGLRQRQVGGVVAQAVELEGGMGVLGDGLHGDAANFLQRAALDDGAGAAEEGGVPQVVAVLHQAVEQLALVGYRTEGIEVLLEGVRREEEVRRLQHRQLGVAQEPAHADLEEGTGRHVVGIEDGDVVAVGQLQRVVEVASLGVEVVRANDVADPGLGAEVAELLAAAVIEHVDVELVLRPVDGLGGEGGELDDLQRLVVGGDVHIHRRPQGGVARQRVGLALQRPGRLQVTQQQHQQGVQLGQHQAVAEQHVQRLFETQGAGQAPVHVAQRGDHRQRDHRQHRQAIGTPAQ